MLLAETGGVLISIQLLDTAQRNINEKFTKILNGLYFPEYTLVVSKIVLKKVAMKVKGPFYLNS